MFFVLIFPGLRSRWSLDPGLKCTALSGLAFGRAKKTLVYIGVYSWFLLRGFWED